MTPQPRPLEGLRVLAGPFCSALLADVGAEVVKIEAPPGGDEDRTRHEPMLREVLESWTRDKSVAEIVAILDAHGVPAAPIWDVEQAVSSTQTAFRRLLVDGEHPVAGTIHTFANFSLNFWTPRKFPSQCSLWVSSNFRQFPMIQHP